MEWVSDGHLFHFSLAKLKKRRPIPLPAIAICEWLSGLGLVQSLLMVLSVSVKSLRPWVPQETPSSKVWLELSTWWMNRGQLSCHGWNHCDITSTVYVLRGRIWRCCTHALLPGWMSRLIILRTSGFGRRTLVNNSSFEAFTYWLSYQKEPPPKKGKNKITLTLRRIPGASTNKH